MRRAARLRQAIVNAYNSTPAKNISHDAATQLCIENKFNPIIQYLKLSSPNESRG